MTVDENGVDYTHDEALDWANWFVNTQGKKGQYTGETKAAMFNTLMVFLGSCGAFVEHQRAEESGIDTKLIIPGSN